MRNYEILYILSPQLDEEAVKAANERFQKVLTDNGAEITSVDDKGRRRLAYEINDFTEGYYVILKVQAETVAVNEFDRRVKLTDDVIRTLVVRDDD
ncbi:SSU ribosomal protein S6p [Geomicrobium sp. JCM 19037]|uniref:30S ribosomal protein S6 n=1 Tax=unclassified Geomicrobium TaxID=2628951 RepID=UPI00045F24C2|nr:MULTISPECIES: 30S ribosomal protein S6 [unclassified Geomicrobium]GAK03393.1 SSU ribosomal protein S6p [Geomicrobium sp. JCM 19037]GAK12012.1 SSU ribosomal protein S6p [Geomicrobium sp. JCM 19039]